jgi:hypothetical protein
MIYQQEALMDVGMTAMNSILNHHVRIFFPTRNNLTQIQKQKQDEDDKKR